VTSHLGAHLQRIGQSAAAVDVLGRVVGLQQHWSKKQPGMWSYLDGSLVRYADALEQAGKHSEAVDVIKGHLMERRLRDPGASQAPLLVRLSRLSHALGRYEEALRAADQAAEDDPQLESARWRQIDALGALADEATRKRQLRRALDYLERQMEVCRLAGESNPEAQQLYEDCQPELVALKAEVARMARRG
jgi:tetratricopeptide (TPR) repeat protein